LIIVTKRQLSSQFALICFPLFLRVGWSLPANPGWASARSPYLLWERIARAVPARRRCSWRCATPAPWICPLPFSVGRDARPKAAPPDLPGMPRAAAALSETANHIEEHRPGYSVCSGCRAVSRSRQSPHPRPPGRAGPPLLTQACAGLASAPARAAAPGQPTGARSQYYAPAFKKALEQ
jgi:hypothetical protein